MWLSPFCRSGKQDLEFATLNMPDQVSSEAKQGQVRLVLRWEKIQTEKLNDWLKAPRPAEQGQD